ncbi:bifunctional DNA primase/polymerase [Pedobacter panaciterrae]|uniref:Bifunctional DNA primase/polymerase n=1 Tax=Pedobacter panaciterrae TaxID=363849 RepID=A0ABU8NS24_9SPHI
MSNLTKVWGQVEMLLADGISLIPVRDKQEGDRAPKTPYNLWKQFQTRRVSKDELWHEMEAKNTSAIAIVCGKISGSLEVIDVDVKYKDGIYGTLSSLLQNNFPALFGKLRIHSTPSGGYHILYRIANAPDKFPGNVKLAGRPATEAELVLNPKSKTYNFLETRGEAGYILAPPSLDYGVHQDYNIPLISWDDRCNLINICRSLNEIIDVKQTVKATKSQSDYYSENPFDDYNHRGDISAVLTEYGWKPHNSHSKHYLYFTRPDKDSGVSGSFHAENRIFWSFTSSTTFDEQKGYKPVDVLLKLKFDGDTRKLYRYLVDNGFGMVKHSVEQTITKQAALANKPLPANFSTEAQDDYVLQVSRLKEDHPYGIFIKYDSDEEKYTVSREAIARVAKELGFRYYDGDLVKIDGFTINRVSERFFQDSLKDYIRDEDPDSYEELCNIYEAFMQKNGKYTAQRLQILDESLILTDDKHTCYKFYINGYQTITADEIVFNDYNTFSSLIWSDKIQHRNFNFGKSGRFLEYLKLAVHDLDQASKVLGYLSHEYKDETTGFIIVLTEQCPDPKQGGGSGKNVFCNLLKLTTTYTSKPGSQAKFDEKFFQSWNRQKIFGISDVPKNFDFLFLKEPATGSFIWKKLFKDEVEVDVKDAPKFIVQTNYSYEISDGGLRRRIIPLEFTNFFTLAGGLDVHFGCHFPNEWNEDDYAGFDTFISESIQVWLRGGNKLHATELTDTGWQKQWEQTYGNATGFILDNWDEWIMEGFITNETFKRRIETYFNENNIQKQYWPSSSKLNLAIAAYGEKHGVGYKKDVPKRFENGVFKSRIFFKGEEPDDSPPF